MTDDSAVRPACMPPSAQFLYAAWCGDANYVRELLAQGVAVDVRDGKGRTALMLAAARDSAETVALLLAAGADARARNKGNRCLMDYVKSAAVARLILAYLPVAERAAAATRLLFCARATPQIVECALAAGARVNARNKRGDTPLLWQCWSVVRHHEGIRRLLAAGAVPHVLNCHRHSPILMALWWDDTALVKLLLEAGVCPNARLNDAGACPLHHAYSMETARVLLVAGADVNATDADGYTPLMQVRGENVELIRFLLEAGADVNAHNDGGHVLAHLHCRSEEVDNLLMEAGARYSIDDMNDVESAVKYPNTRWLRMLLDDGLDVNCVNENGQTLLMMAAWKGHAEALNLLLDAGAAATINQRDVEEGVTALHAAVIACRCESTACLKNVEMLLAAGADVNLPDRDGWTPLHSCAYYNLTQPVLLLLGAGASPSRLDNSGLTPAEMARENGHDAVARLLR